MRRTLICLFVVAAVGIVMSPRSVMAAPPVVVHAGMTTSNQHCDGLDSDAREGLGLGLGTQVPLFDDFRLQPEVWFLQKGFKDGNLWETVDLEMKTAVVSIPVLLSYHFRAQSVDPRAFVGVAADIIMSAETRRTDRDWVDVADETNSVNLTWVLGGGVRKGNLDAEVRYLHGLTAITDFDYADFDDQVSQDHYFKDSTDTTWVLSLGYWF